MLEVKLKHKRKESRMSSSARVFIHSKRGTPWGKKKCSKNGWGLFACIKIGVKWVTCEEGAGKGPAAGTTLRQSKWFVDLKRLKHTQAGLLDGFQLTCHI